MPKARRGRHEGTIRLRKDGRWEARIDLGVGEDGRRNQISAYGKTKTEAQEKLRAKAQVTRTRQTSAGRVKLGEYLDDWLIRVKMENRYTTYCLRAGTVKNHIKPHLAQTPIQNVTPSIVTNVLLKLERCGVGARTRQVVRDTLHVALERACKDGILPSNPVSVVPRPRAPRRPRMFLSLEDAQKVLETSRNTPYYAIMVLGFTTAMREGEIFALQCEDIDFERKFLSVRYTLMDSPNGLVLGPPKTDASIRRIDLPQLAVTALREHIGDNRRGFAFAAENGAPIRKSNFIRRYFKPLIEKAGVPEVTFHELRHTANALLASQGASPNVVQGRMGHTSSRMTFDTYGHVLPGAQRLAADAVEEMFAPKAEFGGQMVVKPLSNVADLDAYKTRKALRNAGLRLVEMRGLEPLTPYMRSKCSTS